MSKVRVRKSDNHHADTQPRDSHGRFATTGSSSVKVTKQRAKRSRPETEDELFARIQSGDVRTHEEFGAWASWHEHTQFSVADVHPTHLKAIAQGYMDMQGRYSHFVRPTHIGTDERRTLADSIPGWERENSYAVTRSNAPGIWLNPKFWGSEDLHGKLVSEGESGFFVSGNDPVRNLLTHEYGHKVDYALSLRSDYHHEVKNLPALRRVSRYASYNTEEGWAESFVAYHNGQYRDLPPEFIDYLNDLQG